MAKRNNNNIKLYREAINQCCNPDCKFGWGLNTHHIHPLAKGGDDLYLNYITLCADCHKKGGVHSRYSETQIKLLVYKLFAEKMKLDYDSSDLSQEEFHKLLLKQRKTLRLKQKS